MRYQVLTATSMKMAVFWDVSLCSLVYIDRRFRGAYCHIVALMMEAVSSSETSVSMYQTRRNIPEDNRLQTHFSFKNLYNPESIVLISRRHTEI
jgi:hypothetical protein